MTFPSALGVGDGAVWGCVCGPHREHRLTADRRFATQLRESPSPWGGRVPWPPICHTARPGVGQNGPHPRRVVPQLRESGTVWGKPASRQHPVAAERMPSRAFGADHRPPKSRPLTPRPLTPRPLVVSAGLFSFAAVGPVRCRFVAGARDHRRPAREAEPFVSEALPTAARRRRRLAS